MFPGVSLVTSEVFVATVEAIPDSAEVLRSRSCQKQKQKLSEGEAVRSRSCQKQELSDAGAVKSRSSQKQKLSDADAVRSRSC